MSATELAMQTKKRSTDADIEFYFTDLERSIYHRRPCDPYKHLALAVIKQALIDARCGDHFAAIWLLNTGIDWMAGCGINIEIGALIDILSSR